MLTQISPVLDDRWSVVQERRKKLLAGERPLGGDTVQLWSKV